MVKQGQQHALSSQSQQGGASSLLSLFNPSDAYSAVAEQQQQQQPSSSSSSSRRTATNQPSSSSSSSFSSSSSSSSSSSEPLSAYRLYIESLRLYPWNWSCWLEFSGGRPDPTPLVYLTHVLTLASCLDEMSGVLRYQYTLLIHAINAGYQHTISTHNFINTCY